MKKRKFLAVMLAILIAMIPISVMALDLNESIREQKLSENGMCGVGCCSVDLYRSDDWWSITTYNNSHSVDDCIIIQTIIDSFGVPKEGTEINMDVMFYSDYRIVVDANVVYNDEIVFIMDFVLSSDYESIVRTRINNDVTYDSTSERLSNNCRHNNNPREESIREYITPSESHCWVLRTGIRLTCPDCGEPVGYRNLNIQFGPSHFWGQQTVLNQWISHSAVCGIVNACTMNTQWGRTCGVCSRTSVSHTEQRPHTCQLWR